MNWAENEHYYVILSDAGLSEAYLNWRSIAARSKGGERTQADNRVKLIEGVARQQGREAILVAAVQEEKVKRRRVKCPTCGYPARGECPYCAFEAGRQQRTG